MEYQVERLHIIGDERPETGLKHKVKRCSFASNIDIVDPITFETVKEPFKPFMVNQLVLSFERDRIIMSPFDETLHKQLTNYEVEKIGANGKPTYTSVDEHFVDALGLAHLAFVLEFKELTNTIKEIEVSSKISFINKSLGQDRINNMFEEIQSSYGQASQFPTDTSGDLRGDRPTWFKVNQDYRSDRSMSRSSSFGRGGSWGSRGGSRGMGRSSW